MAELLEIAYEKFLEEYDSNYNSQIANDTNESMDREVEILKEIFGEKNIESNTNIIDGLENIQKAGFFAGFAYCTKLLTAEKIDFFTM